MARLGVTLRICRAVSKYHFRCLWVVPSLCDNVSVLTIRSRNALQGVGDLSFGTVAGALHPDRRVSTAATVGSPSLESST